ncbi:hypothetical protein GCM10027055_06210 [Janibacter alkaliphilus]|uniref:Uncharacterized protein n=1 Tax=Janibacter alkaliphilus TaxID=1069963 RepID=A0A852X2E2_9MICO|nr:hypothetical protein [Janibacter alkaliphilus]NYG37236.1 hypothetical protein [Janibacter alkaliphilus]
MRFFISFLVACSLALATATSASATQSSGDGPGAPSQPQVNQSLSAETTASEDANVAEIGKATALTGTKAKMIRVCKSWWKLACKGVDWFVGGFVYELFTNGKSRKCRSAKAYYKVNPSNGNAIKYYTCKRYA